MKRIAFIVSIFFLCTVFNPLAMAAYKIVENPFVLAYSRGENTYFDYGSSDQATTPDAVVLPDSSENSVVTPSAITLTGFDEPYGTDSVAIAVGTSMQELSELFSYIYYGEFTAYDAQGNYYYLMPAAWSFDEVDTSKPGLYYASQVPDLGSDYIIGEEVVIPEYKCCVSVQNPGEPDINCCTPGRGTLRFPWILTTEQQDQLDSFAIWLKQDNNEWAQLSEGFFAESDGLYLSQRTFLYECTYDLKVTYPGGQTGVLTFKFEGELSIINYSGGDRDGGDVNGTGPSTGSQPIIIPSEPCEPSKPSDSNDPSEQQIPPQPSHSSADSQPNSHNKSNDSNQSQRSSVVLPDGVANQLNNSPEEIIEDNFSDYDVPQGGHVLTSDEQQTKPALATEEDSIQPEPSKIDTSLVNEDSTLPSSGTAEMPEKLALDDSSSQPEKLREPNESPAPQEQQEPKEAQIGTAVVLESYSPEQTTISGLRLRDLCKDDDNIVFGSGDLTVSILCKHLLAMNLSNSETLSVILTQPMNNQITLAVEASGKSVTNLPGTTLRIRYVPQWERSEITVCNKAGELIKDTIYDGEFLRFTANTTGTYTISEKSQHNNPRTGVSPILPLSFGIAFILVPGVITLFKRKSHG